MAQGREHPMAVAPSVGSDRPSSVRPELAQPYVVLGC